MWVFWVFIFFLVRGMDLGEVKKIKFKFFCFMFIERIKVLKKSFYLNLKKVKCRICFNNYFKIT